MIVFPFRPCRWLGVFLANKAAYTIHHRQEWDEDETFRPRGCFNLAPLSTTSPPNLSSSPNLARLVFTQPAGKAYAHLTHTLHYIACLLYTSPSPRD